MVMEGDSFVVEIDGFKSVMDKWLVPRGAQQAFRAVSYEALLQVGEVDFATLGAAAFGKLDAESLGRMFAPVLAGLGSYEIMLGWLAGTDLLVEMEEERVRDGGGGEGDSDNESPGRRRRVNWTHIPRSSIKKDLPKF